MNSSSSANHSKTVLPSGQLPSKVPDSNGKAAPAGVTTPQRRASPSLANGVTTTTSPSRHSPGAVVTNISPSRNAMISMLGAPRPMVMAQYRYRSPQVSVGNSSPAPRIQKYEQGMELLNNLRRRQSDGKLLPGGASQEPSTLPLPRPRQDDVGVQPSMLTFQSPDPKKPPEVSTSSADLLTKMSCETNATASPLSASVTRESSKYLPATLRRLDSSVRAARSSRSSMDASPLFRTTTTATSSSSNTSPLRRSISRLDGTLRPHRAGGGGVVGMASYSMPRQRSSVREENAMDATMLAPAQGGPTFLMSASERIPIVPSSQYDNVATITPTSLSSSALDEIDDAAAAAPPPSAAPSADTAAPSSLPSVTTADRRVFRDIPKLHLSGILRAAAASSTTTSARNHNSNRHHSGPRRTAMTLDSIPPVHNHHHPGASTSPAMPPTLPDSARSIQTVVSLLASSRSRTPSTHRTAMSSRRHPSALSAAMIGAQDEESDERNRIGCHELGNRQYVQQIYMTTEPELRAAVIKYSMARLERLFRTHHVIHHENRQRTHILQQQDQTFLELCIVKFSLFDEHHARQHLLRKEVHQRIESIIIPFQFDTLLLQQHHEFKQLTQDQQTSFSWLCKCHVSLHEHMTRTTQLLSELTTREAITRRFHEHREKVLRQTANASHITESEAHHRSNIFHKETTARNTIHLDSHHHHATIAFLLHTRHRLTLTIAITKESNTSHQDIVATEAKERAALGAQRATAGADIADREASRARDAAAAAETAKRSALESDEQAERAPIAAAAAASKALARAAELARAEDARRAERDLVADDEAAARDTLLDAQLEELARIAAEAAHGGAAAAKAAAVREHCADEATGRRAIDAEESAHRAAAASAAVESAEESTRRAHARDEAAKRAALG
ncbi:Hypothetical protein, putative, partial [Bodo saltans]